MIYFLPLPLVGPSNSACDAAGRIFPFDAYAKVFERSEIPRHLWLFGGDGALTIAMGVLIVVPTAYWVR